MRLLVLTLIICIVELAATTVARADLLNTFGGPGAKLIAGTDYYLMESGSFILNESGGKYCVEDAGVC